MQARVLLAEDSRVIQEVLRDLLQAIQVSVDVVENGKEAVATLLANGDGYYDMVFMDLHMPVLGGVEATRIIRSQKRFAQLPVIALSADDDQHSRQSSRDAGMDGYLTKPVDLQSLEKTVAQYINTGIQGGVS